MAITATIKKWGNSRSLRIPKSVADQMGLELGSRVTLTPGRKGLLIQKKRQPAGLQALLTAPALYHRQSPSPANHRERRARDSLRDDALWPDTSIFRNAGILYTLTFLHQLDESWRIGITPWSYRRHPFPKKPTSPWFVLSAQTRRHGPLTLRFQRESFRKRWEKVLTASS